MKNYEDLDNALREVAPLLNATSLNKYALNPEIERRFMNVAARGGKFLYRSRNKIGIKTVTKSEMHSARLDFFTSHRKMLRKEYWKRLREHLSHRKRHRFVELISDSWADGGLKRNSKDIQSLKASIKQYTDKKARGRLVYVNEKLEPSVQPFLKYDEISDILDTTSRLIDWLMQEYVSQFPTSSLFQSTNDIWIHRGIHLSNISYKNTVYYEHRYISSYSLAISVSEKFSKCVEGKKPVLVGGMLNEFYERILFFSELIPNLELKQFEFGVIPHWNAMNLKYLGKHAGIYDYEVESKI